MRTVLACSSLMIKSFPILSYPKIFPFPYITPFWKEIFCPAFTRTDVFLLSFWASVAIIVNRSSPSSSFIVQILSSVKYTSTPYFFNVLVCCNVSTVFLAKRETSLVTMRSNAPFLASSIISRKLCLLLTDVPVIPSSMYLLYNFHSGWYWNKLS